MSTWVGAIVETRGRADFADLAAKHHITVTGAVTPWVLVQGKVGLGSLGLPAFAEELSRELQGTVIAFAVQTTASNEEIEHWEKGQLVRKLAYQGDGDGWFIQSGRPQAWEAAYFFADDESTADDARWPLNLGDELTDDDVARYERARAAKDASGIMDLLHGGSVCGLYRLCTSFGVDPEQPGARSTPPPKKRSPWVIAAAIIALGTGLALLGALRR